MNKSIQITPILSIDESEIKFHFMRASGPGGQKVNRAATAVQLRFNVVNSTSLPDDIRGRLMKMAANRISNDGILVLESQRFRSQDRNRADAINRFIDLLRQAAVEPTIREETKPTRESKERRLEKKHRRSQIKRHRKRPTNEE